VTYNFVTVPVTPPLGDLNRCGERCKAANWSDNVKAESFDFSSFLFANDD
jgi:hypothetical protein